MIPNSAFITVGERRQNLEAVAAGKAPGAEYATLVRQGHFCRVVAMVDEVEDLSARGAMTRFATRSYLSTWGEENIYLGEEFPGIQYLAVHAVMRRKKRIAMMIHNVASMRRQLPLATLRLGRLCDHLLCISEKSREELLSRYGVPSERITVIGSRVDTEFFTSVPAATVKRQICAAGAVNRDYQTLIDAVKPLEVPTKIAADTAWRYSTGEQQVGELPAWVEMRSWGSYPNLRALYAESAVVVVPLKKAMLSGVTVALEAMAMGKPVILTHNPYVEEFLRDGENGFFVPPDDAAALRDKIAYLLDHPAEAARLGARAREWVVERFSVQRYVAKILSVWR
jgi:glycosyltransferase involved in cell wall biosynthesis